MTNVKDIKSHAPNTVRNISYNQNFRELQAFFNHQITEETLMLWMSNISDYSRKVIECKFGLIGTSTPCKSFKELNERLGIDNSKKAFEAAIKELEEVKYLIVFADLENLNKRIALGLGRLVYAIEIAEKNGDLLGEKILEELNQEEFRNQASIFYRYGIAEDGEFHTLKDTAEYFGKKSAESLRRVEIKIGRHFRHPEVRRKISLYYGNCYKEKLEQERLEKEEREKHPERFIPLSCLKEQNDFDYPINDIIMYGKSGFSYIYQVANSNPEELAILLHLNLDNAEKLCIAARNFNYGRYLKLATILKKDLNEFNLSSKAKELLIRIRIYNTKDFLEATPSKLRERQYTKTVVVEEILGVKETFINSFSSEWSIEELSLSEKALTLLRKKGIETLKDFLLLTEEHFEQMNGITKAIMKEFDSVRACFGYEAFLK